MDVPHLGRGTPICYIKLSTKTPLFTFHIIVKTVSKRFFDYIIIFFTDILYKFTLDIMAKIVHNYRRYY